MSGGSTPLTIQHAAWVLEPAERESTMSKKLLSTSLMLCALALACADGTAPLADGEQPTVEPQLHHLRWANEAGPVQFTATAHSAQGEILALESYGPLAAGGDSTLSLATYEAAFWAVQGEEREIRIYYLDAEGGTSHQFFEFEAKQVAELPDGSSLASGDSVLITVTVDPDEFVVQMGPAGLQFDNAEMEFHYGGANGDFNGDGVIDETDAYIQQHFLGIWYQAAPGDPWTELTDRHYPERKEIEADIWHFSGYAISW